MTFPPLPGFLRGNRVPEPDYVLLAAPYSNTDTLQPFALGIRSNQLVRLVTSPDNTVSPGPADPCLISPDGKWTLVSSPGSPDVVPAVLRTNRLEFAKVQTLSPTPRPTGFAFAPDSSFFIYAEGRVYTLGANGEFSQTASFLLPNGAAPRARGAAFHPDGDSIVIASANTGSGPDGRAWNTWSKDGGLWVWRQYVPRVRDASMKLVFNPVDGLMAEIAEEPIGQHWVYFWDRAGNVYVEADNDIPPFLVGGGSFGYSLEWSPDGQYLATIGPSISDHLRLRKYADRSFTLVPIPEGLLPSTGAAYWVAFSPDSKLLAVAHEAEPYLTVLSIDDMTVTKEVADLAGPLPSPYLRLAFHPSYQPA